MPNITNVSDLKMNSGLTWEEENLQQKHSVINIRCETCHQPTHTQLPGQYSKVCFPCFSNGLFFSLNPVHRRQLESARKHGIIYNWKENNFIFKNFQK